MSNVNPRKVAYERVIPEIFGVANLYDAATVISSARSELKDFYAETFTGSIMFGQDNVINFYPLEHLDDFHKLAANNDEIRYSSTAQIYSTAESDGEIIIPLMRPGYDIYGHWLLDLLPKLTLFERLFDETKYIILIDDRSPKWVDGLIKRVATNNSSVRRIKTDEIIQGRFFLTSPIRHHDLISEDCQLTFRPIIDVGVRNKKIYLSRKHLNLNHRQLKNSARIERLFKSKGFQLVYPEELSIHDQIKLFAETSILAGEAGSGLHNSVFCSPETVIINLQSGRQNHFIQSGLCNWYSQTVLYVFGKTATDDWGSSFKISSRDCRHAIARAEDLIAGQLLT